MAKPGETGLRRIISAAGYSLKGLRSCWSNEAAFRQEVVAGIFMFPLALWLGETGVEKALLAGSLVLVLIVEILNSGIEAVVDRIGHEHHDLSGRAKDLGSAAVMLSLINVAMIWTLVLFI
jgi:diacylglycerol kinase (ATP)